MHLLPQAGRHTLGPRPGPGGGCGDRLLGDTGNDWIEGRGGADTIDGGGGLDTASYSDAGSGVSVNLGTGTASGGDAQGDVLIGLENLEGSQFADVLAGDIGSNLLAGLGGNDTFRTGGGNDSIEGGAGSDTFVFAGLYDDAQFTRTTDGWDVTDFRNGEITSLVDVENVQFTDRAIYLDGRNNAPVLVADATGPTLEDTAIIIPDTQLLANDSDFDGDEFILWSVGGAQNGTVALDGFNNVVFTPNKDFNGTASFTYTVRDSQGGFATQTATVNVAAVNDAPRAADDWVGTAISTRRSTTRMEPGAAVNSTSTPIPLATRSTRRW